MHSSRMRTARSLIISRSIRWGVCPTTPPGQTNTCENMPFANLAGGNRTRAINGYVQTGLTVETCDQNECISRIFII